MRKFVGLLLVLGLLLANGSPVRTEEKKEGKPMVPAVLNFKMKTLDGKETDLAKYQGKVILLVNVASQCGYTKQYKELEALHEKYGKEGLVVLGVPANEFGGQEPGTDVEIAEFCKSTFGVKFDMLSKVAVDGDKICPLYKFLTNKETNPQSSGPIKWNFTKFLINRKGEIVARFEPAVKPDAKEVLEKIEASLKAQ
jgi:glutathione peroxidase